MKKILLGIIFLIIAGALFFIFKNEIRNVQDLKRTVFEATHDRESVAGHEAFSIAYDAFLYGLVRVKGMLLERRATHPKYRDYAPINQFHISKELAKPGFTDFTPNCDTYYGLAWLDVSKGPILLTLSEIPEKYYTIQATDAGLNTFNYIGSRMKSEPGIYAYCPGSWNGELADSITRIDCPTNQVFLQARYLVQPGNKEDEIAVQAKMRSLKLAPLNTDVKYELIDPNSEMANPLNTNADFLNLNFYQLLNEALTKNPPTEREELLLSKFSKLNIGVGKTFDENKLSAVQKKAMQDGQMAAFRKLYDELKFGGEQKGGFNFRYDLGDYKNNFPLSAAVAFYGYGANTAEEALYVTALVDSDGEELNGKNNYHIHFEKNQLPPVDAFWSITMYSRPDNQLIENEINRYNIGGLTPGLKPDPENGSVDIFIQNKKPEDVSNWLPVPEGNFWVILRMYNPKKEVLDRKYVPPIITRL